MKNIPFCIFLMIILFAGCEGTDYSPNTAGVGVSGSTARFAISGNYLYTVDADNLNIFNIANPSEPKQAGRFAIGSFHEVETIFARETILFVGTSNGVQMYDISKPTTIKLIGTLTHVFSCDPVVADSALAYATIQSGSTPCFNSSNELLVIDIRKISAPFLKETYPMESPGGLGIHGNRLYVCDRGIKVFERFPNDSLALKETVLSDAYDLIPLENILLTVSSSGVSEYAYSGDDLTLLSTINITGAK